MLFSSTRTREARAKCRFVLGHSQLRAGAVPVPGEPRCRHAANQTDPGRRAQIPWRRRYADPTYGLPVSWVMDDVDTLHVRRTALCASPASPRRRTATSSSPSVWLIPSWPGRGRACSGAGRAYRGLATTWIPSRCASIFEGAPRAPGAGKPTSRRLMNTPMRVVAERDGRRTVVMRPASGGGRRPRATAEQPGARRVLPRPGERRKNELPIEVVVRSCRAIGSTPPIRPMSGPARRWLGPHRSTPRSEAWDNRHGCKATQLRGLAASAFYRRQRGGTLLSRTWRSPLFSR